MTIFVLTLTIVLAAIAGMAIGVLLSKKGSKKQLRGSCGGPQANPNCCQRSPQKRCKQDETPAASS
ncbi:MAG: hypothetical protein AAF320_06600 [Myxococcota bacterium]